MARRATLPITVDRNATTFVVRDQSVIGHVADMAASDLNICLTQIAELEADWFARGVYKKNLEAGDLHRLEEILTRATTATRGLLATRDPDEVVVALASG